MVSILKFWYFFFIIYGVIRVGLKEEEVGLIFIKKCVILNVFVLNFIMVSKMFCNDIINDVLN